jgi:hypothetical protein
MLRVNADSTYTFKWGPRAETTGTIADQGNRVVLNDSSGTQITLVHSGDTLYRAGFHDESGEGGVGGYPGRRR